MKYTLLVITNEDMFLKQNLCQGRAYRMYLVLKNQGHTVRLFTEKRDK